MDKTETSLYMVMRHMNKDNMKHINNSRVLVGSFISNISEPAKTFKCPANINVVLIEKVYGLNNHVIGGYVINYIIRKIMYERDVKNIVEKHLIHENNKYLIRHFPPESIVPNPIVDTLSQKHFGIYHLYNSETKRIFRAKFTSPNVVDLTNPSLLTGFKKEEIEFHDIVNSLSETVGATNTGTIYVFANNRLTLGDIPASIRKKNKKYQVCFKDLDSFCNKTLEKLQSIPKMREFYSHAGNIILPLYPKVLTTFDINFGLYKLPWLSGW